jgi:hypothetical protein
MLIAAFLILPRNDIGRRAQGVVRRAAEFFQFKVCPDHRQSVIDMADTRRERRNPRRFALLGPRIDPAG